MLRFWFLQGGEDVLFATFVFIETKNGVVEIIKVNIRDSCLNKCPKTPIVMWCQWKSFNFSVDMLKFLLGWFNYHIHRWVKVVAKQSSILTSIIFCQVPLKPLKLEILSRILWIIAFEACKFIKVVANVKSSESIWAILVINEGCILYRYQAHMLEPMPSRAGMMFTFLVIENDVAIQQVVVRKYDWRIKLLKECDKLFHLCNTKQTLLISTWLLQCSLSLHTSDFILWILNRESNNFCLVGSLYLVGTKDWYWMMRSRMIDQI